MLALGTSMSAQTRPATDQACHRPGLPQTRPATDKLIDGNSGSACSLCLIFWNARVSSRTTLLNCSHSWYYWEGVLCRVGDGDCGTTLAQGAQAIKAHCSKCYPLNDVADCMNSVALSMGDSMGGSSGALYQIYFVAIAGASFCAVLRMDTCVVVHSCVCVYQSAVPTHSMPALMWLPVKAERSFDCLMTRPVSAQSIHMAC